MSRRILLGGGVRVLGVLCLAVLLSVMIAGCGQEVAEKQDEEQKPVAKKEAEKTKSSTPPGANADKFVGFWVNENPQTEGMTRVEITNRQGKFHVHTWGKCHPEDCDQGEASTDVSDSDDGTISIARDAGFKEVTLELTVLPDGRLQVVEHSHYTDNSGRSDRDSTYYFKRGTKDREKEPDKKQQGKKQQGKKQQDKKQKDTEVTIDIERKK